MIFLPPPGLLGLAIKLNMETNLAPVSHISFRITKDHKYDISEDSTYRVVRAGNTAQYGDQFSDRITYIIRNHKGSKI